MRKPTRRAGSKALAALAAALLAACPQLETPLAPVTGRIVGARAGAYAYPLGRPDMKVALAGDGSFRLQGVPTEIDEFVLFDGVPANGRAERVVQELNGGEENRIPDRYGSDASVDPALLMPLAGTVVATVSVDGGATVAGPSFTFVETDQEALTPATGGQITIYPLAAGSYELSASLAGFTPADVLVQVEPGLTVTALLTLQIDLGAPKPGCAALPGCDGGLSCNPMDGRCY